MTHVALIFHQLHNDVSVGELRKISELILALSCLQVEKITLFDAEKTLIRHAELIYALLRVAVADKQTECVISLQKDHVGGKQSLTFQG